MKLNIYTDGSLTEVKEVREVPRMKIPYRVGQYIVKVISDLDMGEDQKILDTLLASEEQITAVVRATFGLSEEDLDCIDAMELADLAKEIIAFASGKLAELGKGRGDESPNPKAPATA